MKQFADGFYRASLMAAIIAGIGALFYLAAFLYTDGPQLLFNLLNSKFAPPTTPPTILLEFLAIALLACLTVWRRKV